MRFKSIQRATDRNHSVVPWLCHWPLLVYDIALCTVNKKCWSAVFLDTFHVLKGAVISNIA